MTNHGQNSRVFDLCFAHSLGVEHSSSGTGPFHLVSGGLAIDTNEIHAAEECSTHSGETFAESEAT